MASSSDPQDVTNSRTTRKTADDFAGDVTATDLPVAVPEYLREMQIALERTEQAYASGNLTQAVAAAAEGQAAIRLSLPKLNNGQSVPPYYQAFFHCFRIQPEFRRALALYKRAALRRDAPRERDEILRKAWQILDPATAGLADNLSTELLVYDHPIAGRVLRGVVRLRQKLREALTGR
ncbi:MAG TPA: hypothetical protein VEL76_38605 [Gemmataceae bacterium]|nr:hypothetical protein [Gemmataceae bacterium]